MPKIAKPLGALAVSKLQGPGYHAVGTVPGLHLQLTPGGGRSWILRSMVAGKRREIGLGPYPAVTLQAAHEAARRHLATIKAGSDPVDLKKAAKVALSSQRARGKKFKAYAEAFIDAHEGEWKNAKHGAQWRSTLATHAYPLIGDVVIAEIDTPLILRVLKPIWHDITETANRVRGRIEKVLDSATSERLREGPNPAAWKGHLDLILPAPKKIAKVKHHPSLPYAQCPAFMKALDGVNGQAPRALAFAVLTAVRSGPARMARWKQFDFKQRVWTIPADHMKADRDHRVPLTEEMLELLKRQGPGQPESYVFPSPKGGGLSDMALSEVLRGLNEGKVKWIDPETGRAAVPHGFRSSFRNWAGEQTAYPFEVAEAALAHKLGDSTEIAYFRSDLFEKRRAMMKDWTQFLRSARLPK